MIKIMKQLPVLSSAYYDDIHIEYAAKRESGANPGQSCCCVRAVIVQIHCRLICEKENGDATA